MQRPESEGTLNLVAWHLAYLPDNAQVKLRDTKSAESAICMGLHKG